MPSLYTRSIYHFYGYDPRGSRFYDRLIRANIEAQCGSGKLYPECRIERGRTELFTKFHVTTNTGGGPGVTTVSIVRWEKFIAKTLLRSNTALIVHGYWMFLRSLFAGVTSRIFQYKWKLATAFNVVFLGPVVTALILTFILLLVLPDFPLHYQVLAGLGCLAGSHALIWALLMKRMFPRFFVWGIVLYMNMGGLSKRMDFALPEYDALLDRVAEHIAREIEDEPHRQFVLVGHSAGAILAVEVAGRLLELLAGRDGAKPVRLVTLGGAWAILTALDGERGVRHRATVAKLLSAPGIEWADIASPRDILSISDTKARMSKIIRRKTLVMRNFEYVNPKFREVFKKETRLTNAVNIVQMHFQYLLIPSVSGRYNYLNMIFNPWGDSIRSFVNQRNR